MHKYNQIFGVDISKDVFDVMSSQGKHLQFENSSKGFNQFTKKDLIVMQATGYYHYCLAQYLYDLGYIVSVVNPLSEVRVVSVKWVIKNLEIYSFYVPSLPVSTTRLVVNYMRASQIKGKVKNWLWVAVINKLLKQAFAVAKSGVPYDENYVSNLS